MKYTIKIDNHDYLVEIHDLNTRPVIVSVNGTTLEVWPGEEARKSTPESVSTSSMPANTPQSGLLPLYPTPAQYAIVSKKVVAPIPGVIIEILVKPGEEVVYEQGLFVIEAMKMKNIIRSTRDGKVTQIFVTQGQSVNHSQNLLEFEG